MYHRSHKEFEGMRTEFKYVSFFNCNRTPLEVYLRIELGNHLQGLRTCHKLQRGEFFGKPGNKSGMIGLDVMQHEIIGLCAFQGTQKVLLPFLGGPAVR